MFLVKGVKLQGIVTWFDNFSMLLRRDGQSQLVYKHAISTIMPSQPVDAAQFGSRRGQAARSSACCRTSSSPRVRDAGEPVTMFLVNGVMLQGAIAAFDLFCMLLERDGFVQLVYKHAVSTIQPAHPVDLAGEAATARSDAAERLQPRRRRRGHPRRARRRGAARRSAARGTARRPEARLDEAAGLAEAIGIVVVERQRLPRARSPAGDPVRRGPGRADRRRWCEQQKAELVIVDARADADPAEEPRGRAPSAR